MSDIVERLRAMARAEHDDLSIAEEAADALVALHARAEKAEYDLTTETRMREDQDRRLEKAEDEIERLRKERDAQYDENVKRIAAEGAAILRAEEAETEIERLRNQVHVHALPDGSYTTSSAGPPHNYHDVQAAAEIEKLDRRLALAWKTIGERDAEIERLRKELDALRFRKERGWP